MHSPDPKTPRSKSAWLRFALLEHRFGAVAADGSPARRPKHRLRLYRRSFAVLLVLLGLAASLSTAFVTSTNFEDASPAAGQATVETEAGLKVAFVGDHGTGPEARAVLRLIKSEGADLVISQGDLGYEATPEEFDAMVDEILGPDFPFFASFGNHDRKDWRRYRDFLEKHGTRNPAVQCIGDAGSKAACNYKGLFFITSSAGVFLLDSSSSQAKFMERQLARSPARWRICSWHLTQNALQVGEKEDQTGWAVYEACRKGGAIIVTGHAHSYARSHLISSFSAQPVVASRETEEVEITPGRTIALVSGLGGRSVSPQVLSNDWWASIYTADQEAEPGALFCSFNVDGEKDRARCAFKTVSGATPDRFDLIAP